MYIAVVIPAYKDMYLHKTLQSFANQTRKNFTVYIGDDNSPNNIKAICDQFSNQLNIRYTRFNNNIGSKNLVHQWTRCIALAQKEEWIWLFSDDDLIDPDCVENFYRQVQEDKGRIDIYRFNTTVIDNDGKEKWVTEKSPAHESSEALAYYLLNGQRGNSLADHIFSRKVYERSGGLVFTEYAQGADWAMSILFSKDKGLVTIPHAHFYWRYSGQNISSTQGKVKDRMIEGHLQFLQWALRHFEYLKLHPTVISYDQMQEAMRTNLKAVLLHHYSGFSVSSFLKIFSFMHRSLKLSFKQIVGDLLPIIKITNKTIAYLSHLKNGKNKVNC